MNWSSSLRYKLVALFLIFFLARLTELAWKSPFYTTPQEKFTNILKMWIIGIGVCGSLYLIKKQEFNETSNTSQPYRKKKRSREEVIRRTPFDEQPEYEYYRKLGGLGSSDLLSPDAKAMSNILRRKREAVLEEYSNSIVDYYFARQEYGKHWLPNDYTLIELIKNRHPGLYSEDISYIVETIKRDSLNMNK